MTQKDFFPAVFLLFLAVGACVMAYNMKLGTVHEPGAGLVPFGVAALLGLMSLGLLLRCFVYGHLAIRDENPAFKGVAWVRVLLVLCTLLGYGLVFEILGFHICTFFLVAVLLRLTASQRWWLTGTISLITVLVAYAIFELWLGCPFPRGPFGI
ncbi:MAG: tripartite tricarboxylate transporter TctB family protein [Desulfobacteraceae bacterium]|nr:MAG: tripartite tricarboxylate transporter TctB family protein [Desulfobacteraceae bacterium]